MKFLQLNEASLPFPVAVSKNYAPPLQVSRQQVDFQNSKHPEQKRWRMTARQQARTPDNQIRFVLISFLQQSALKVMLTTQPQYEQFARIPLSICFDAGTAESGDLGWPGVVCVDTNGRPGKGHAFERRE
mmetsp:Transcript_39268/g.63685  ORF Transcript_39268/g.63685 Transcript_39268/m.63685 type:complete len:130 (-) Transcript_39268:2027-2416(-)